MARLALPRHSSLLRALLAAAVFYYARELSAGDRGVVDLAVLGLAGAALLYNLVQLGRLLSARAGKRALWHLQRTLLFWAVALLNTVWLRPEQVGTWRQYLGWAILAIAIADTAALALRERKLLALGDEGRPG